MVDANFTTIQNVYDYRPQNLLISYGIVFVFTLVALILGVFSFHRNGTSYDILVSTIGTCMQNPEVSPFQKFHASQSDWKGLSVDYNIPKSTWVQLANTQESDGKGTWGHTFRHDRYQTRKHGGQDEAGHIRDFR